jgi:hypothetical protein
MKRKEQFKDLTGKRLKDKLGDRGRESERWLSPQYSLEMGIGE